MSPRAWHQLPTRDLRRLRAEVARSNRADDQRLTDDIDREIEQREGAWSL
jgi:hypothetical protein